MPAQPGNQSATKLKDSETKAEAYRQYCAHIASGYPKEAFALDHPTISITWETMDKYIKQEPDEFPAILMKVAMSKRMKHWFDEGRKLVDGTHKKGSPVVWQTIMRNIFKDIGWDRQDKREIDLPDLLASYEKVMLLFSEKQSKPSSVIRSDLVKDEIEPVTGNQSSEPS